LQPRHVRVELCEFWLDRLRGGNVGLGVCRRSQVRQRLELVRETLDELHSLDGSSVFGQEGGEGVVDRGEDVRPNVCRGGRGLRCGSSSCWRGRRPRHLRRRLVHRHRSLLELREGVFKLRRERRALRGGCAETLEGFERLWRRKLARLRSAELAL